MPVAYQRMECEKAEPHVHPAKRIGGIEDNIWSLSHSMVPSEELG